MFLFGNPLGQASQLLHSADIDELKDGFRPGDLGGMILDAGLDPRDLAALSPQEVIARLRDAGIDTNSLDSDKIPEQLRQILKSREASSKSGFATLAGIAQQGSESQVSVRSSKLDIDAAA